MHARAYGPSGTACAWGTPLHGCNSCADQLSGTWPVCMRVCIAYAQQSKPQRMRTCMHAYVHQLISQSLRMSTDLTADARMPSWLVGNACVVATIRLIRLVCGYAYVCSKRLTRRFASLIRTAVRIVAWTGRDKVTLTIITPFRTGARSCR